MESEKNWYRWSYLQSDNTDTDEEDKHGYQQGSWRVGWIGIDVYTLLILFIK